MIGWHQADVSHFLSKYAQQIWGDGALATIIRPGERSGTLRGGW